MSSYSFNVDTSPMAREIQTVSHGVNRVSGAVVAMQTAVVAAEHEGAEMVCKNVNRGFYALMHSQITQKIAQLTSTVEAKLIELGQYAAALKGIQGRMTKDYHMITGRYLKVFNSLNHNLEARIAELDTQVFRLVDRDVKLLDSRIGINSARFAVNQLESVLSSQLISTSRVKKDADVTLEKIAQYVKDTRYQTEKSDASMYDVKIDAIEDVYVPVSIVESTTQVGSPAVNYYVARSGNAVIDKNIDASVREQSVNSVLHGSWAPVDPDMMSNVALEFDAILDRYAGDERVKDEIRKMFALTKNVKQLKSQSDEL